MRIVSGDDLLRLLQRLPALPRLQAVRTLAEELDQLDRKGAAGLVERPFPSDRERAFEDGKSCALIYAGTHSPRDTADICESRNHWTESALRKAYNDGVADGLASVANAP